MRLNFYRCHLIYFVATILICSGVLYGSSASTDDHIPLRYIDALFLAASAMTSTGLNTVNLGSITAYQQSVLFVLMLLGDLSTVSISVVVVRRIFFRKKMKEWVDSHKAARQVVQNIDGESLERRVTRERPNEQPAGSQSSDEDSKPISGRTSSRERKQHAEWLYDRHHRSFGGVTAPWELSVWDKALEGPRRWLKQPPARPGQHHYLSFEPDLDDKGRFRTLTNEEYAELGGVEYRALKLLCWILPSYTAFWVLFVMIILAPYAAGYGPVTNIIRTSQPGNLDPGWWGVFISLSAYTNCGLDPINASMIPFRETWLVLIVTGGAIMAGNTFYPIFLRFYIWLLSKLVPKHSEMHHSLSFLLHHPRRCYLWLFDRKTTWILTAVQIGLILLEWVLYEIFNIHQTAVWALPAGTRAMIGLYSALGTRSSGFYTITVSSFAPALKVFYMIVMYLSVFPLIISLRSSNVYEERSVGLEADEYEKNSTSDKKPKGATPGTHIQNQLAYDLWWIVLSWILISIIEEPYLNTDAPGFTNFSTLFEIISAYGNCGLSLGVPFDSYSFCATWGTLSKLILITVMLRGRHRILPMAIDRSILLPGQGLMEEMDRHYNPKLRDHHKADFEEIREAERGSQAEDPDARQDPEPKEDEDATSEQQA